MINKEGKTEDNVAQRIVVGWMKRESASRVFVVMYNLKKKKVMDKVCDEDESSRYISRKGISISCN